MKGDERVRHCAQCRLNVYNISEMSVSEARSFLDQATGRVCVRYYRRRDGTIITRDCPVGLAAVRKRFALWANAIVALVLGAGQASSWANSFNQGAVLVTGKVAQQGALAAPPAEEVTGDLAVPEQPKK